MPDYFLKKKSLLDRFKDNHGRTGYIQSARAEHTWSNPIKRNRRTKELNGWIKSFAGKKHIRKLARFNTFNNGKNENLEEAMNWINVTDNTKEILKNGSEKSSLNTIEDVVADLAYAQAASNTAFGKPTTAKSILWKAAENFKDSELNFDDNGSFIEDFIVNYEDQFREIYPYAVQDCDWLKLDPDFDKTYNSDDKFPFVEWVISQVAKELFKYAPADAKESKGVGNKPTEAIQINPPIVMYKGDAENAAKAHDYLYKKMPRVKGASISSDMKPLGNNKFCRVLFYGNKTGVMELFRYYSNLFNHDFWNNCDADPQGWVDPRTIARYDVATPRQESKKPTDEKLRYEKGYKNSRGEDAPWVIRSHEDNHVLASFANKKDAKEHLKRMKQYSKTESKTNEEAEIKDKQYYLDMFDKAYKECVQLDIDDGGDGQNWADYFARDTSEDDPTTFSQKEADEIVGYYMEFHPNWEGETGRPYKDWMENIDNTPKTALDKEITRILKALYAPNESKQTERQGYAPYYFCRSKYPDGELAVLADGDSIHYLPSYNIKGFKDKIDYGTIATSFEPIENPETSELHKIVQRKDGRNIIALTQAEFDDFAENNGWGGRDKWFKDILRNRHIIESNDTRERAVDDYDTLTDGLSELGFVPSSDIRNGMIYPYRSRFTATKDGVKYHFWIHEDPSGEYTDYIEVWGGKFTTNGDPEDPEATKFNTVSDVLDNLKSVKKSEAMAGKHESKDVSLKEIARTLDTAINKDGNYSVKDNTSGVTATDKDRTQTIKVSKDLKVELEDTNGKHSYEAQSLRDLSKYIRRAVKGEYVNEDFHKTQVKDAVYDVINRHNLNNAVKVSYLGNSVVCKYADRTLRIQPYLLTTMSTKDGDNVDTYPTNLKELDGYLDRVFGHYADELAESKQSEGLKLDYVDTITVPQWLWEAYLLGNEYGGDLTDDEQTILYDFKEKYKDCHLDDRGEEPDFHSRNDFDCYGGNCYVVDVYTKTDVKEKKSEKLFNKQELEALARGADILDQLQYRFSFSFYSPKTYTDAVDTALAMDAEDDKRIAHETIGDSEFRLYTDDPYDAIRFRDGLSNRAGIPAEDLASTFRSAVGIRKNGGFATEDEQDTIGRYAAENYVSFSVSEDNSTMYVEGELPNVVEFFEAISSAEPA